MIRELCRKDVGMNPVDLPAIRSQSCASLFKPSLRYIENGNRAIPGLNQAINQCGSSTANVEDCCREWSSLADQAERKRSFRLKPADFVELFAPVDGLPMIRIHTSFIRLNQFYIDYTDRFRPGSLVGSDDVCFPAGQRPRSRATWPTMPGAAANARTRNQSDQPNGTVSSMRASGAW